MTTPNKNRTFFAGATAVSKDLLQYAIVDKMDSSYYSGLDVSIYFGAIFMDEIVSIQWQELEQIRPIKGYADFTIRGVVRGARIVQGSFTINFKESGYIPKLLQTLRNPGKMEANLQRSLGVDPYSREAAQRLATSSIAGMALKNDVPLETFVALGSSPSHIYNKDKYKEVMDQFDQAIWGKGARFAETDVINPDTALADRDVGLDRAKYWDGVGFDIIIKYGEPEDSAPGRPRWGTAEKIVGCHVSGSLPKTVDDSGKNILETYSFIAQSVV